MDEAMIEKQENLLKRLRRIEGQLRGLQRMVETERDCQEVLTQLASVRSALEAAGDVILETYLEKCAREYQQGQGNTAELIKTLKLARA
jgi:DNA-binding FrmR family transcriptional regulator